MAFDGIVLKSVVSELNTCLINGKINKVYMPNSNEILLGIYSGGKNYCLLCNISSNSYRIHLTTISKPNPLNATNFCMLLRKHLVGFRILNISTLNLERIVTIELEGYNELNDKLRKKLIIELMGKHSNIILLNENNKIIDSIRHLDISSGSLRDILPAREYILPNNDTKLDFYNASKEDFMNIVKNDITKSITNNYTGFSNSFISSILENLNISNDSFSQNDLSALYDTIRSILLNIEINNVKLVNHNTNDYVITTSNTEPLQVNFFLDDFYSKKEEKDSINTYRNNLLKLVLTALKKISKKLDNINTKLKECDSMDKYRIYGELITSNLYKLDSNQNAESVVLENYYDNNNEITIPLDKTISISYNAKKFFKKYHKLKNTLEIVSVQKQDTIKEIDYLESIVYELENANSISDLDEIYLEISENGIFKGKEKANVKKNKVNKKKVHDEYEPIIYTIDGFILYVGKNNKQNDYITTKLGKNEDYWFHTKDIRGSHCLLKCNGKSVKEHTLVACCQIAAFHSKAKLSSNVPVDYCFVKYVKKPNGSKPGMVIYTNNKTMNVNPTSKAL